MPPRNLGGPTLHSEASVSDSCYAAAMSCLASGQDWHSLLCLHQGECLQREVDFICASWSETAEPVTSVCKRIVAKKGEACLAQRYVDGICSTM